jgi:manganese/zinc/iron transport system permease protein
LSLLTFYNSIGFNTFVVLCSTFILGISSGYVGTFLLLRRRALLSDALAHGSLPGLCLAFIIGTLVFANGKNLFYLLLGASFSSLLSTFVIQFIVRSTRLKEDAALASVLSVFFGFGITLLSIIQSMGTGQEGGLNHFIYGQTAAMGRNDVELMLFVATCVFFICILLHKELGLLCFNQEFSSSIGQNINILDFILMIQVTLVIMVGLQAVGMLLVIAMLIIPPSAARFWTNKLSSMVILSSLFGGFSGLLGSYLSASFPDLPAGGVIVLVLGSIFSISFLLSPDRGLLFGIYKDYALKKKLFIKAGR